MAEPIDLTTVDSILVLQAGDDVVLPLAEDPINPATWDGYTDWFAQLREGARSTKTHTITVDASTQAAGVVRLSFPSTITKTIVTGWRFGLRAKDADGLDQTLIKAKIVMEPDEAQRP